MAAAAARRGEAGRAGPGRGEAAEGRAVRRGGEDGAVETPYSGGGEEGSEVPAESEVAA